MIIPLIFKHIKIPIVICLLLCCYVYAKTTVVLMLYTMTVKNIPEELKTSALIRVRAGVRVRVKVEVKVETVVKVGAMAKVAVMVIPQV